MSSLLQLALTCSKVNIIVLMMFLYEQVQFKSVTRLIKFAQAHLPQRASPRRFVLTKSSSKIKFITSVHFVNPPMYNNLNQVTTIAGSYSVFAPDPGINKYKGFVRNLQLLLNDDYGLKKLKISGILPQFKFFPDFLETQSAHSLKLRFKETHRQKSLSVFALAVSLPGLFYSRLTMYHFLFGSLAIFPHLNCRNLSFMMRSL